MVNWKTTRNGIVPFAKNIIIILFNTTYLAIEILIKIRYEFKVMYFSGVLINIKNFITSNIELDAKLNGPILIDGWIFCFHRQYHHIVMWCSIKIEI